MLLMSSTMSLKARKRTGTSSLDITIPTEVVDKFGIKPGDVFILNVEGNKVLTLRYERIYEKK